MPGLEERCSRPSAVADGPLANFTFDHSRPRRWGKRAGFCCTPLRSSSDGGAVVSHVDLTITKDAEDALRQSEARFRGVVESLGEGLLLADAAGLVWYANSRMAQLTGYDSAGDVRSGPSRRSCGRPTTGAGARAMPGAAPKLRSQSGKDGKALLGGGQRGPAAGSTRAGRSAPFMPSLIFPSRRQSREASRKSQASLLLAQRIGHVGSWELDLETRLMEWSAETYRIFDWSPEVAQPGLERFLGLIDQRRSGPGQARAWTGARRKGARSGRTAGCLRRNGAQRMSTCRRRPSSIRRRAGAVGRHGAGHHRAQGLGRTSAQFAEDGRGGAVGRRHCARF